MRLIKEDLVEWASLLEQEIKNDSSEWFCPKGKDNLHIFDNAHMKFMNRNLNYTDLSNMVSIACAEKQEWHPGLKKTIEFCKFVRSFEEKDGIPFGRMVIWKVLPHKAILAHNDAYEYHDMIMRYIFFVSKHPDELIDVVINQRKVRSSQGVLFEFNPRREQHKFVNNTNEDLLFLAWDVWDENQLNKASCTTDIEFTIKNPKRYTELGMDTEGKYISEH